MKRRRIIAISMLALSIFSISTVTSAADDYSPVQNTGLQGVYGGWSEDEGYFTVNPVTNASIITTFAPSASPKSHRAEIKTYRESSTTIREYIVATTEWPDAYHYTIAQYENAFTGSVTASSGRVYGMDQTTAISGTVDGEFNIQKAKSYYGMY